MYVHVCMLVTMYTYLLNAREFSLQENNKVEISS